MGHLINYWRIALYRAWLRTVRLLMPRTRNDLIRDAIFLCAVLVFGFLANDWFVSAGLMSEDNYRDSVAWLLLGPPAFLAIFAAWFVVEALLLTPAKMWTESQNKTAAVEQEASGLRGQLVERGAIVDAETSVVWLLRARKRIENSHAAMGQRGLEPTRTAPPDASSIAQDAVSMDNRGIRRDRAEWIGAAKATMELINEILGTSYDITDYSGMDDAARNGVLDRDDHFSKASEKAEFLKVKYSERKLNQFRQEALARIDGLLRKVDSIPYAAVIEAIESEPQQLPDTATKRQQ